MKQTLVIGSTTLDVIITVPSLPSRKDDVNIQSQTVALGGCAYNVHTVLRLAGLPHRLCSPVGTGMYGDHVFKELAALGIEPFLRVKDRDNGCCYCYVEPDGERTFISYHGVEYAFSEAWMDSIDPDDIDSIYVCGLEIEEPTGSEIVSYLRHVTSAAATPPVIYFGVGPRLDRIGKDKMEGLLALGPVVHLNKEELLGYTGEDTIVGGAKRLFEKTKNAVVVTDGAEGSYYFDGDALRHVASTPVAVVDTIGAGDSHMGAIIACRKLGYSYEDSLRYANRVSAAVVAIQGATLSGETFGRIAFPNAPSGS